MITFGAMKDAMPGDGGAIAIMRDGVQVGEIVKEERNAGSIIVRRYVVDAYVVSLWDADDERRFDASSAPRAALAAAKAYARAAAARVVA